MKDLIRKLEFREGIVGISCEFLGRLGLTITVAVLLPKTIFNLIKFNHFFLLSVLRGKKLQLPA